MDANNELLQAIGQMMDSKLEPITTRLDSMDARLQRIEDNHQTIREDITDLNEKIVPKINKMYDALNGVQEKFEQLDQVKAKQADNDHRIFALEQLAKEA